MFVKSAVLRTYIAVMGGIVNVVPVFYRLGIGKTLGACVADTKVLVLEYN